MISLVVSSKNSEILHSTLIPSLYNIHKYIHDNDLPKLDVVVVEGDKSLTKNYNNGIDKCKYDLRFFIHEDVDLLDHGEIPLFIKIYNLFKVFPDTGLVGLVGTTEMSKGFWWECSRDSIKGSIKVPNEHNQKYWIWDKSKSIFDVCFIDGFFMATDKNFKFSEDIDGFNLYDLDYCNLIRSNNYKIKVFNHMVLHTSSYKNTSNLNFEHYRKKWCL